MPDGRAAGYDWSINFSGVAPGVALDVPPTATHVMTTSTFAFFVQNSSCQFGEGTATATSIWVLVDEVVVAFGTVNETVADCGWDARTMSAAELVDVLVGLMDCSFGDGQPPTCIATEPVAAAERSAAEALLRMPGA